MITIQCLKLKKITRIIVFVEYQQKIIENKNVIGHPSRMDIFKFRRNAKLNASNVSLVLRNKLKELNEKNN